MDTTTTTSLCVTVIDTQGEPPITDCIVLAPGQTARVGRIKQRCQLSVADRWLAPVHFEVSAGTFEHSIHDLSSEARKHRSCDSGCFEAALRNRACSGARCVAHDLGACTGLYLNGERIQHGVLRDSDLLVAGTTSFRIGLSNESHAKSETRIARTGGVVSRVPLTSLFAKLNSTHLYVVLDAARGTGARRLLLQHEDLSYSLYDGPAAGRLADVAPYLIRCEPDSYLLRSWLSEHWGAAYGYFMTSDAPFKMVRRHLRKFLKVKDSQDRLMHFRFYDPRVLRTYLATCSPSEVNELFGPITRIVLEGEGPTTALAMSASSAGLHCEELRLDDMPSQDGVSS